MKPRVTTVLGGLATAVAMAALAPVPVAGQTPSGQPAGASAGAASLRTAWGEPDLQGIWSGNTLTPLERPQRFAGKTHMSEAEEQELLADLATRPGRDRRAEAGTEKDVAGAYNAVWENVGETFADRRTSLIIDPADGKVPPLTAEAQKRVQSDREYRDALLQGTSGGKPGPISPRRNEMPPSYNYERLNRSDGPEDRSLSERCMGGSMPDFNAYYRIVQSPGQVAIYHDTGQGQSFTRIIPVSSDPHLPAHVRTWWGDARAKWEGDTLVVDITNFTPKGFYRGSREGMHLIERFRRVSPTRIDYQVTIDDPTTFTKPWTVAVPWNKQNEKANRIFEPGCHEGNYGMLGMLANTRAAEKAFAEGSGPDPALQDNATGGGGGRGID